LIAARGLEMKFSGPRTLHHQRHFKNSDTSIATLRQARIDEFFAMMSLPRMFFAARIARPGDLSLP
jgi:hypothetical protein